VQPDMDAPCDRAQTQPEQKPRKTIATIRFLIATSQIALKGNPHRATLPNTFIRGHLPSPKTFGRSLHIISPGWRIIVSDSGK
jgi:hypothetical protein